MRVMACLVAATTAIAAGQSVRAQTYDPNYPVCMQTYGPFSGINCSYTSMASCWMLAQGRSAQCLANPYFVQRRKWRHDVSAIRLDLLLNAMSSVTLHIGRSQRV